ncbi:hypothetical protein SAMN05444008_102369 [Cnuella takakiae]|uniref:Uncharacterized protein n=1 Tax=Cnuella takakiae TaxID=1302690 RepID=A0A1M4VSR5_9BACT|nr:hypothetical protein SAMN05444008_102369 [Cnuella takakiae]
MKRILYLVFVLALTSCNKDVQPDSKLYRQVLPSGMIIYHTSDTKHICVYPDDFERVQTKCMYRNSIPVPKFKKYVTPSGIAVYYVDTLIFF